MKPARTPKYRNVKCEWPGEKFDSKAELRRYLGAQQNIEDNMTKPTSAEMGVARKRKSRSEKIFIENGRIIDYAVKMNTNYLAVKRMFADDDLSAAIEKFKGGVK